MDNNIYKLLNYLASTGVGIEKDIANPLREIFIVNDPSNASTKHRAGLLQRFLDYLIADNLIYMTGRPDMELGKSHPTSGFRWLGDLPIAAAITLKGYDILSAEKARQQGTDLESSTKHLYEKVLPGNFVDQKSSSNWSLKLAGVSILFIAFTAILQLIDKTPQRLRELSGQVHYIGQALKDMKLSLDWIGIATKPRDTIYIKVKK